MLLFLDVSKMSVLGFTLIVGGMACLCSGLIFLIPVERKHASSKDSFEESRERIEYCLWEARKERGEL
jgi:hypothetical protein